MHEQQPAIPSCIALSWRGGAATRGERCVACTQVAQQAALIEQLLRRVQELEAWLPKDSHNSSKPPSVDTPFKKPPPRSLRKACGKKPGGQKGHPGATLGLVDEPDRTLILPLTGHCDYGRCCAGIVASPLPERRQVTELVIRSEVSEYRIVEGVCAYDRVQRSAFPPGIDAPVQYGPRVSAFAMPMTQYQFLPYQRTAELLYERAWIAISPATIYAAVMSAATRVQAPVQGIGQALVRAVVAHADETGVRVGGKLHGLQVLSTDPVTTYFAHAKHGQDALEAFGLLADFGGILVHDHGSAYDRYEGLHAFSNAHHPRELIGLVEDFPAQTLAAPMIDLLGEAKEAADQARDQGARGVAHPYPGTVSGSLRRDPQAGRGAQPPQHPAHRHPRADQTITRLQPARAPARTP